MTTLKEMAARRALEFVQDGMLLGLGTGSTTRIFIDLLGERRRDGGLRHIRAVSTSQASTQQAAGLGIPLTSLADLWQGRTPPSLDLAVDGADEVDPGLNLIKGLGLALLREKIVEIHARRFVVIVDDSKLVARLGMKGPLPVEILPYEAPAHVAWLGSLGCRAELWLGGDGSPVLTDNGNYVARCWFEGGIPDVHRLARQLADRPGIIEHGLFLDMASDLIVASPGGVRHLTRSVKAVAA